MAGIQDTAEQRIISMLLAGGGAAAGVVLGAGDDAAVCQLPADTELLTTTDALVEGTHFVATASPRSLGHRALAVNLSDIAAMGGEPLWAQLALSIPEFDADWVAEFAAGLQDLAREHNVTLTGGDTVRGPRSATLTLQGSVPAGSAVRRDGARTGDLICVTGHPGDAIAGRLLLEGRVAAVAGYADYLRGRFEYPRPRVAAGQALRDIATAMLDVSDGLHTDLARLLSASGLGASPDLGQLRLSDALVATLGADQARDCALLGGEDYELVFTAPPDRVSALATLAAEHELPVSVLGEVTAAAGLQWQLDGRDYELAAQPFEHFL